MAVKYQDYYETLGVPRDASAETIQTAFRKLARKYHPDVNKGRDAEDRFKQLNEAYEVLRDPKKRARYDQLGSNWQSGQDFTPPPGWEEFRSGGYTGRTGARSRSSSHGAGRGASGGDRQSDGFGFDLFDDLGESFSDFFQTMFGGAGRAPGAGAAGRRSGRVGQNGTFDGGSRMNGSSGRGVRDATGPDTDQNPADLNASITVTLEEAYSGAKKTISLAEEGRQIQNIEITIPAGVRSGKRLRLRGQGHRMADGSRGDLYLEVRIAPHPVFRVVGEDLETSLSVTPWEAALGAKVTVPLVEGSAVVTIAPGTQSGKKLRLKGKGLAKGQTDDKAGAQRGDLFAVVQIVVPTRLTTEEERLFRELDAVSPFRPRG